MSIKLSLGNFYGLDSIIDLMIILVSLLISYQSSKIYKYLNNKNYKIFSWSFLCIAIAYFFKIIANLTILYKSSITETNFILHIAHEFNEFHLTNFLSFTLFKTFLLLGFLILFLLTTKTFKKEDIILFSYLSVISILFSVYFSFIFYLTLVVLLIFLTIHFHQNYTLRKSKQSYKTYLGSAFMLAGYLVSIFYSFNQIIYLAGEILVFVGFFTIFLNHIKTKNDQKKNKA
ncbi:MAG: hypothetical protein KC506_01750 [Nanoarchaeota archaeon]|nr:hypothetical protein [Nanoarchaeota archaeon]